MGREGWHIYLIKKNQDPELPVTITKKSQPANRTKNIGTENWKKKNQSKPKHKQTEPCEFQIQTDIPSKKILLTTT